MPIPQAERYGTGPDDYDAPDPYTQDDMLDDLYTLGLWDDIDEWDEDE